MMRLPTRARYRILVLCTVLVLFRFFVPRGRDNAVEDDISGSINSILRLSARICKAGGNSWQRPPETDHSRPYVSPQRPPVHLPQVDKSSSKSREKEGTGRPSTKSGKTPPSEHHILVPAESLENGFFAWSPRDKPPLPKPPYKPAREQSPPISDPFPLLSKNLSPFYKNLLDERTKSPGAHAKDDTPLLIGFTRNWPQLIQCVVSYISAGWPAEDIYVVENTGVMHANRDGKLTLQNPYYLNYTQLAMLGVKVMVTPTLLTFSQLQNFYAWTALDRGWTEYFWSHQNVMVFSFEDEDDDSNRSSDKILKDPSKNIYDRTSPNSLYHRALATLQYLRSPSSPKWAHHFFAYDYLTLVNRDAVLEAGAWDTHIPYYAADCDMYVRLMWAGYWQGSSDIGIVLDVASVLDDVGALLRIPGIHASFRGDPGPPLEEQAWWKAVNLAEEDSDDNQDKKGDRVLIPDGMGKKEEEEKEQQVVTDSYETSHAPFSSTPQSAFLHEMDRAVRVEKAVDRYGETWQHLVEVGIRMESAKYAGGGGSNNHRNIWQTRQAGGQGEPFYRDPEGFETGVQMMIDLGRSVFAEKWGHRGCDIARTGIRGEDAWRLETDWEGGGDAVKGGEW